MGYRKAEASDIDVVERIYDHIHDSEEAGLVTTGWIRGVYPVRDTALAALEREDLYVCENDGTGEILAAGIINRIQLDVYADCDWRYKAPDDKVSVMHTLVVEPSLTHQGTGSGFVRFWEELARGQGCEVLRLDTNKRNTVARGLYAFLGFEEAGIAPTVFNGIPGVELVLIEKKL